MPWSRRSSVPISATRSATVTFEQSVTLVPLPDFALTNSTSLSRICAVRPQTPSVRLKLWVIDPSTLWPDCTASASWSRIAAAPKRLVIAPPLSTSLFASTMAMPSVSVWTVPTVYANTSRLVPEPRT